MFKVKLKSEGCLKVEVIENLPDVFHECLSVNAGFTDMRPPDFSGSGLLPRKNNRMNISPTKFYYKFLKPIYLFFRFRKPFCYFFKFLWYPLKTRFNLFRRRPRSERCLEIGADFRNPVVGFETLSIEGCVNIDYALDASKTLPFRDKTFKTVYASHVLEHIPWYMTVDVLKEWHRILQHDGILEVWVPDGLKICQNLVRVESGGEDMSPLDNYYNLVREKDSRLWASLRIFAFGDGKGALAHPNWHRAMFTPSLLTDSFKWAGFVKIEIMDRSEVRGRDHGWINLGVRGVKP